MELSFLLRTIIFVLVAGQAASMFTSIHDEWLAQVNRAQKNYGVAVTDVDNDGELEMIVAGYDGANLVLKYNKTTNKLENMLEMERYKDAYQTLQDADGRTLGVCACDIDGDGREEIYVLNSGSYSGRADYPDKIFKWRDGKYVDLYNDSVNKKQDAQFYAGRSVACVDRNGSGKYGFILATYSENKVGQFALIEMDESDKRNDIKAGKIVIKNVASEAGIARSTGGRGIVVGPILQDDGKLDIYFDNEPNGRFENSGENYLFKNLGNGKFQDVAAETGVADKQQAGRGLALADFNTDGLLDIVYGNWMGEHRLFLQSKDSDGNRKFEDVASKEMADPSSIRTVMAADFDNDGNIEVFYNNINSYGQVPNRLFRVKSNGPKKDVTIDKLDIGDAKELDGYGTGGAYTDFDGDGFLEVLLAHGESGTQPLTLYKVNEQQRGTNRNWLRVMPKTQNDAPARGATVTLTTSSGLNILKVIDSGSGYLCQMEPVAHFGLADKEGVKIRVQWPDGSVKEKELEKTDQKTVIIVPYPDPEEDDGASVNMERRTSALRRFDNHYQHNQQPEQTINTFWEEIKEQRYNEEKNEMLVNYLQETLASQNLPMWAYGFEKLPSQFLPVSDDFIALKKRHAEEIVRLVAREMQIRARDLDADRRRKVQEGRRMYYNNNGQFSEYEREIEGEVVKDLEKVRQEIEKERRRNNRKRMTDANIRKRLERRKRKSF